MKILKIMLSMVFCLVLLTSLAGCGSKKGDGAAVSENGGKTADKTAEGTVKVTGPVSEAEKLKKYSPEITLSFNKSEVVTDYPEGQDAQNNAMYDMWADVMGIRIENQILCPTSSMTEKMQLAIASDDIPDIGIVDTTMIATLIENNMVEDMTEYYGSWATENLKEVAGQNNNALFAPVTKDGAYMAIPVANTLGDSFPIMWIRSDWLDALGLKAPETMDEALDVAMAFATKDPDGNGAADTYGLYLDKDLTGLDHIMAAYGVYSKDEYWVKTDDGSFIAGCTDTAAKKPLARIAELYSAGAIDPEFAVKDASKEEELIAAGNIGIYIGYFYSPLGVMKDCVANVDGADWAAVKMPAAEGIDSYKAGVNLNVYGYLYVKKGIKNPEAAVVILNHLCDGYGAPWLTDEDSEFYTKYNELASREEIRTAGANNLMPFQMAGNINWGEKFVEAYNSGAKHVEGKDADYQNVISTSLSKELQWAWKKVYLEGYLAIDFNNVSYSGYTGAPTETAVKTQSLLNTQKLKDYIAIIMGEQPVDYFDTFVKTYNNVGAKKIAEEIKDAVQ